MDTCSTDRVTKNLDYIEDVNNCARHEELTVSTNGVSLTFDWKVWLTFLPLNVHVNENSLAAILPFKDVYNIPGVRVTTDISTEKAMKVIMRDVTVFKFKEYGSGLYYYDMKSNGVQYSDKTNVTITPCYPL